MPLLQPKLNLKVAQRQILTPGLMQMVSVLALNKLELKEMINAEIVENPVLEEMEERVPILDEVAGREAVRDRSAEERVQAEAAPKERDPFEEIDFGSYFQDYLDPGYRTGNHFELSDKPSFENFLSVPQTLADHLSWQLGSLNLAPEIRSAAEYIVGNLNENGYLVNPVEDLAEAFAIEREVAAAHATNGVVTGADTAIGQLKEALEIVRNLDPIGIAATSLRESLLLQIATQRREFEMIFREGAESAEADVSLVKRKIACFEAAALIVSEHLGLLQKRDPRELARAVGRSPEEVQEAIDLIRTLDPKPGQRYSSSSTRLIEPDVAFVKRGDEWVIVMNEEDLPTLRLNHGYKKLLTQSGTEKDVKEYVKERYRSALQLMRNIEQRKSTILRTCETILRRQPEFLDRGVEGLRPMMIKEVAEEIGVHPSTVSRAVSNKYVHTPQGVFELRFFFSEAVNGPEGAGTPLMLLKRKVKKLIEEENPQKPLTDDQIAALLQAQGIKVTRRTVAKYREDLNIPSTHQRRIRG